MIRIGWASRDVTPEQPAMLQGQKVRRIARSAMDPLTVTAWALEDAADGDAFVLVSADITNVAPGLMEAVRERVAALADGPAPEQVVVLATHTHTSLVMMEGHYPDPDDPEIMKPAEGLAWVADRIAAAVGEAWERRAPRAFGRAFGHAVVGHNRYAVYADGKAVMYGGTDREDFAWIGGYEDHGLDMLFAWSPGGDLEGVALAIPCPSQVDEGLHVFSADYWHDIRFELRARLGAGLSVLGLCAPAGDQSPRPPVYKALEAEMRERRGLTLRQEIARRVADAVVSALSVCGPEPDRPCPLVHRVARPNLTPRRITQADRDWAEEQYPIESERRGADSWFARRLKRVMDVFDGHAEVEPVDVELHVARLGDAVLATNPFELFLDYALRIKARSPAAQTILTQLTAGAGGYLPTRRAARAGSYGAHPASSRVGPEGGDELVEETLRLIGEVMSRPGTSGNL